ncbi:MAGE-like protein 2 [Cladorrhinum sp. PSN259]|nr:MAGE-like protein 2 [Cladorrhinum sp. PSN259]
MAIRNPFYAYLPIVLNFVTLILCCLVIFSGFHKGLTHLYWVKVNTADFKAPSKLDSSQILKDIGQVSGSDLTGSNGATAESLGYPKWMGISLFTQCDHFVDGHIECYKPSLNLAFDPDRHLKLSMSSANSGENIRKAVEAHNKAIRFISGSFVVSAFCALTAPLEAFFSPALSAITCGIASLLLFAGDIAGAVLFRKLSKAINDDLLQNNVTSSTGSYPMILGFVGALLMVVSCILYIMSYRSQGFNPKRGGATQARSVGGKGGLLSGHDGAHDYSYSSNLNKSSGATGGGLLNRIIPGNNHKYVQVEEQGGDGRQEAAFRDRDVEAPGSPTAPGMQRKLDEDWATPDQFSSSGGKSSGVAPSIPMLSLSGNKGTKDLNTAYEPYSNRQE